MNESAGVKVRQLNYQEIEIKRDREIYKAYAINQVFLKKSIEQKDIVLMGQKFFVLCL